MAIFSDISHLKDKTHDNINLALKDPLTKLANRSLFEAQLEHTIHRYERESQTSAKNIKKPLGFCLLFMDLNDFKLVNDTYGHCVGDDVLREVGKRFQEQSRQSDLFARIGGDEFVIILPQTDLIAAEIVSSSVHAAFISPISTSEGSHQISTSIGLSTSNKGKPLQEALIEADLLIYEEKKKWNKQK